MPLADLVSAMPMPRCFQRFPRRNRGQNAGCPAAIVIQVSLIEIRKRRSGTVFAARMFQCRGQNTTVCPARRLTESCVTSNGCDRLGARFDGAVWPGRKISGHKYRLDGFCHASDFMDAEWLIEPPSQRRVYLRLLRPSLRGFLCTCARPFVAQRQHEVGFTSTRLKFPTFRNCAAPER